MMNAKDIVVTVAGTKVEFEGTAKLTINVDEMDKRMVVTFEADPGTAIKHTALPSMLTFMGRRIDGDLTELICGGWTMDDVRSMLRLIKSVPPYVNGHPAEGPLGKMAAEIDVAWNVLTDRVKEEIAGG